MERTFRDILSHFLEESESESTPEVPRPPSEIQSDFASATAVNLGGWRPSQRENPTHQRVLRYKSKVPKVEIPSEKPDTQELPPPPVVEPLTPLEDLDKDSRLMVGILIDLGATDLQGGVSLTRVKKAYRRLAKKYHPDLLGAEASLPQKEAAKNAFYKLQKAYEYLCEFILVEAPSHESVDTKAESKSSRPA